MKSIASAGLLAYITVQKYCDALPLYRQSHIFKRAGIEYITLIFGIIDDLGSRHTGSIQAISVNVAFNFDTYSN